MRFRELLTESDRVINEKSDARIHHIEDMLIWHGSEGAQSAINTLSSLSKNPEQITIKWDGSPAVIFGRDESGEFILTDKSGFTAKGYDGKVKSAAALQKMLLSRGKEAPDASRQQFAQNMANIFDIFEQSVPEDFKGYVFGDLLYFDTPELKEDSYVFKPNLVTYKVKAESDIGRRIARSNAGVVVHMFIDHDGNKHSVDMNRLSSGRLLIMPPVSPIQAPSVDTELIASAKSLLASHGAGIDKLLDDGILSSLKLSDFKATLYSYVNFKTRTRSLDNLAGEFVDWLSGSKLSEPKKERVKEHISADAASFKALFDLVTLLMKAKNDIISQLDNQSSDVEAYTNGDRGGEGYVIGKGDAKLVNRSGFSAANMNKVS